MNATKTNKPAKTLEPLIDPQEWQVVAFSPEYHRECAPGVGLITTRPGREGLWAGFWRGFTDWYPLDRPGLRAVFDNGRPRFAYPPGEEPKRGKR